MLAAVCCVLSVVCGCLGMAMYQSLGRLRTVETELLAMRTSYETLAEDFEGVRVQSVFAVQEAAPVETEPDKPAEEPRFYRVEAGDSLGYISRKFYGDNSGILSIMEANGIADPDHILVGQELRIP